VVAQSKLVDATLPGLGVGQRKAADTHTEQRAASDGDLPVEGPGHGVVSFGSSRPSPAPLSLCHCAMGWS
jgi:hypothetical protein